MKKIGIIGCGKIAKKHLKAYKNLGQTKITVSDRNPEKAKKLAKKYGMSYLKNPEKLIKSKNIDIIDVCVPTPSHKEIITTSIENKKHVFCEKPMCITSKEAQEIKEVVQNNQKELMIGYLYRFHPSFQLMKKTLDKKIIGNPYYSIFRIGGRGGHREWKHTKKGGGATYEMLVHMIDLALWFFGDIKKVEKIHKDIILKKRFIDDKEVNVNLEDFVFLKMLGKKKNLIFCEGDLITPSYMNYVEIHGTNGSAVGSILKHVPTFIFCKKPKGNYKKGMNHFNFPQINLFEKELEFFLKNLNSKKKIYMNSVEDSIKITEILEKIQ